MEKRTISVNLSVSTNKDSAYESFVTLLAAYLPSYLKQMKKQVEDLDYDLVIQWAPELEEQEASDKTFQLLKHHFENYVLTMAQLGHIKQAYQYLDDCVEDLWIRKP